MPGLAVGLFLLPPFFAADLVDRPAAIGMLLQPAIGQEIVKLGAGHRLSRTSLAEGFPVAIGGESCEQVLEPGERFDSVQLGAGHQRVEVGRIAARPLVADEQKVPPADRREFHKPLCALLNSKCPVIMSTTARVSSTVKFSHGTSGQRILRSISNAVFDFD